MDKMREPDMENFSDRLDTLLTLHVQNGDIAIDIADLLHSKIVDLFQDKKRP
jgi:hypothetical protein